MVAARGTRTGGRWFILAFAFLGVATGCNTGPRTDAEGGGDAPVSEEGPEYTAETGEADAIAVEPDVETRSRGVAELDRDPPSTVGSGTIRVPAAGVDLLPGGDARIIPRLQGPDVEADITVLLAAAGEEDVCQSGVEVLDFTARLPEGGNTALSGNAVASLTGPTLEQVASGRFAYCLKIVANYDGAISISAFEVLLDEAEPPTDDPQDNDNQENVNDNTQDNTNDNTADNDNADANDNAEPNDNDTPVNDNETPDNENDTPENDNAAENDNTAEENQPPVAVAGEDQTVAPGQNVFLDGGGSSDPDGDELTYSWQQTEGIEVLLHSADTSSQAVSFVAPNTEETLVFELTVSDGTESDTDSVTVTVTAGEEEEEPGPRMLFVANGAPPGAVLGFANPAELDGDTVPTTVLRGTGSQVAVPAAVVVNNAAELLVLNTNGNTLTVYADAATATGEQPPTRIVEMPPTLNGVPTALAYDGENDRLFVAFSSDTIAVYDAVSDSAFDGELEPNRTITGPDLIQPRALSYAGSGTLYVGSQALELIPNVLAFDNAGTLDGASTPRIITIPKSSPGVTDLTLPGVFVDAADWLFAISNDLDQEVFILAGASTLSGTVLPEARLTIPSPPAVSIINLLVDTNGTGYVLDQGANAVYMYDNLSTQGGEVLPDRTLVGNTTEIAAPNSLFLWENEGAEQESR